MSLTPSEELVAKLCAGTFLSPWTIANPIGREPGKELCDVLVVCDPDVVIISVKEIEFKPTADGATGMRRWTSRAVSASIKQIYGAERVLTNLDRITAKDGTEWLHLPPLERRRTHRIAVALGGKGEVPITDGDAGKGFVHVLDEGGVFTVLAELDTITDFVTFLSRTEALLERTQVIISGIEDLLGLYLQGGRKYPEDADLLILTDDIWKGLASREEFKRRKQADEESYLWDSLIELIANEHNPALTESHGPKDDPDAPAEKVIRLMAREDRFSRRLLAGAFREFHQGREIRSRVVRSPSGTIYVFLATPGDSDRLNRRNELLSRMFIARGMHSDSTTVVGLATEEYDPGDGFSLDSALYHKPDWTDEDQARMKEIQRGTGAFQNPRWTQERVDEYPGAAQSDDP
jgi:hypothetical protein